MTVASEEAARLSPSFDPLETWAHRALAAETVPSTVDAFEDRLFEPMQGRDDIVDAWLVRTGTAAGTFSAHGTPPPLDEARFAHVRAADRRELEVAIVSLDDPRTEASDPIEVVVIAHTARPSALEEITFVVAFARRAP